MDRLATLIVHISAALIGMSLAWALMDLAGFTSLLASALGFCAALVILCSYLTAQNIVLSRKVKALSDHLLSLPLPNVSLGVPKDLPLQIIDTAQRGEEGVVDEISDDLVQPAKTEATAPIYDPARDVRSAIAASRIDLFVQPIFQLPNRKQVAFECLARLRADTGELIYPKQFYRDINDPDLIQELDNYLLLQCAQIIRQFGGRSGLEDLHLNLADASLLSRDFLDQAVDFLLSDPMLSETLVLEIPHATLVDADIGVVMGLRALADSGYRISVDNAPADAGEADRLRSLGSVLWKTPAHLLARDEHWNAASEIRDLGYALVATQLEDEKTLIELNDLQIGLAQGFHLAKPCPWSQIFQQKSIAS